MTGHLRSDSALISFLSTPSTHLQRYTGKRFITNAKFSIHIQNFISRCGRERANLFRGSQETSQHLASWGGLGKG